MQTVPSRLRVRLKRAAGLPGLRLSTEPEPGGGRPPRHLPIAAEVLRRFCEKTGSIAQSSLAGTFLNVSTTAHILGGAVMASSPEEGVVDNGGRAFGYENLWILDGSIVPANLGVNPSLTITALAEHAMASVPPRGS
jgi:cholesterol oxidase